MLLCICIINNRLSNYTCLVFIFARAHVFICIAIFYEVSVHFMMQLRGWLIYGKDPEFRSIDSLEFMSTELWQSW
jgi:hypothetical protein